MQHLRLAIVAAALLPLLGSTDTAPGRSPHLPGAVVVTANGTALQVETVASGLETIWDMTPGPNGELWITERGGTIARVDLRSGAVEPAGELDVTEVSESGLMGLALHPDFPDEPWVYAAHSYAGGTSIRNRLVRLRWDGERLGAPEILIDDIPGNRNHNGSRLAIGPDDMLYMTMGDAGRRDLAQERGSLAGKILRLTLDGGPAPGNPFGDEVWSYGHRNPQGLAFHPETDALYAVEHGPRTDDEVNRIEPGRNYGWPAVAGFCDEPEERQFCDARDVVEPVHAWTPTVGTAGGAFYAGEAIPGWDGSLLVTSLRGQSLFRIELTADGGSAADVERLLDGELGRIRAVFVGPDGAVYLATSNRDGRGRPADDDDRIVRLMPAGVS